ncbi:MAG: hypothetical protein ACI9MU_001330 [Alphaproteobacteria bacterium]|jgi:hypothetical protein
MRVSLKNSISLKNLGAAAILATATVFAGAASAATIVQNQLFSFGEAEASVTVAAGATDSDTNQQTFSFSSLSKFNTGLGTLNSVSFNVSWTGEVEVRKSELNASSNYSFTHLSTVTFRADGITNGATASASVTDTIVGHPFFPINAVGPLDIAGGGTSTETSAAFLALFSGPGSIASSIELENVVDLTVTSGGPVFAATRGCPPFGSPVCGAFSGNTFPQVRGNLQITYDYTEASVAMSAPGGMALLGLGLIGMGAARRRRT